MMINCFSVIVSQFVCLFLPHQARVCDICVEDECADSCNDVEAAFERETAEGNTGEPGAAAGTASSSVVVTVLGSLVLLRNNL